MDFILLYYRISIYFNWDMKRGNPSNNSREKKCMSIQLYYIISWSSRIRFTFLHGEPVLVTMLLLLCDDTNLIVILDATTFHYMLLLYYVVNFNKKKRKKFYPFEVYMEREDVIISTGIPHILYNICTSQFGRFLYIFIST